MAWSPLAGGRLMTGESDSEIRLRDRLARLAGEYDATSDQLALAWVKALPGTPQVVVGSNRIERIKQAAAAEQVCLNREHWYELWEAAKGREIP